MYLSIPFVIVESSHSGSDLGSWSEEKKNVFLLEPKTKQKRIYGNLTEFNSPATDLTF